MSEPEMSNREHPVGWLDGFPSPALLAEYERVRPGLSQQALEILRNERELTIRRAMQERSRPTLITDPRPTAVAEVCIAVVHVAALGCGTGLTFFGIYRLGVVLLITWCIALVLRNSWFLWELIRSARRGSDSLRGRASDASVRPPLAPSVGGGRDSHHVR